MQQEWCKILFVIQVICYYISGVVLGCVFALTIKQGLPINNSLLVTIAIGFVLQAAIQRFQHERRVALLTSKIAHLESIIINEIEP